MKAIPLVLCSLAILSSSLLAADPPKPQLPPTHAEVSYGPHARNVLDFWKAEGDGPRPLLVYIHGGGWTGGDKKQDTARYQPFLDKGISCAAINYRLSGEAPLPAPVHDAARAIQFLRTKAAEWNIDTEAHRPHRRQCRSLHVDVAAAARRSGRSEVDRSGVESVDPGLCRGRLGRTDFDRPQSHRRLARTKRSPAPHDQHGGRRSDHGSALKNYDKHRALYVEFSPYNHVDGNDPPLLMTYGGDMTLPSKNAGHGIHHPVYGVKLKEKSDAAGHECHLLIPGTSKSDKYANVNEFLLDKLLAK